MQTCIDLHGGFWAFILPEANSGMKSQPNRYSTSSLWPDETSALLGCNVMTLIKMNRVSGANCLEAVLIMDHLAATLEDISLRHNEMSDTILAIRIALIPTHPPLIG